MIDEGQNTHDDETVQNQRICYNTILTIRNTASDKLI